MFGGVWRYKETIRDKTIRKFIYECYLKKYGAFIGAKSQFASPPILPHGFNGIHISNGAVIGDNCTIFQQVTIGSNTLKDHRRFGSPHIGDNVYIGAGAKIIGNVNIGSNCRIGANAVVIKDIEDNSTVVSVSPRVIIHKVTLDNSFIEFK